jgi:hypothetical protein
VPQYVIDAPGGGGKVPVNPDYVERITDDEVIFRNYEGQRFVYPLKSTPVPGQGVLPVQTKFGANGDFVTDLYQSHLAGRSTSSSRRDEAEPLRMTYRAWRVSLEP